MKLQVRHSQYHPTDEESGDELKDTCEHSLTIEQFTDDMEPIVVREIGGMKLFAMFREIGRHTSTVSKCCPDDCLDTIRHLLIRLSENLQYRHIDKEEVS